MRRNSIMDLELYSWPIIVWMLVTCADSTKSCTLKMNEDGKYTLLCERVPVKQDRSTVVTRNVKNAKRKSRRQGPPGPIGPPGPSGRDGKDGVAGARGLPGLAGIQGTMGRRGNRGAKGANGDPGTAGLPGPQGMAGLPGNCIKPRLTRGVSDDDAEEKMYHCLPGPTGPQGLPGSRGPEGEKGEQGTPGAMGPGGSTGSPGRRGAVGMPGIPGNVGLVACSDYYTDWQGSFSHLDSKNFDGFFCPLGSFLQGFKIDKDGIEERYHYRCCKIT